MRVSQELEQWADGHNTSREIASAIADMAKTDKKRERLWSDPTKSESAEIIRRAWDMSNTDDDKLFWGRETIYRTDASKAAAALGRVGGKSKSNRKIFASRENGKKGGRPLNRINQFIKNLRNDGLSDYDIAAGLGNGDIERPEWLSISESTDHLKAWDNETDACAQFGFVRIDYSNED